MTTLLALCALSLLNTSKITVQDQGVLVIHYEFKNDTSAPLDLSTLLVTVEGEVSNSACRHSSPALSQIEMRPDKEELAKYLDDEPNKLPLSWVGHSKFTNTLEKDVTCNEIATAKITPVYVEPQKPFSVEIRIHHSHVPFGEYHPLLGRRDIEFREVPFYFKDSVNFDLEDYVPCRPYLFKYPKEHNYPEDDPERPKYPNTLFLVLANGLGISHMHNFTDIHVRYKSKMVLEFRYMIAQQSNVTLNVSIKQYMDGPALYRPKDEALNEAITVRSKKQGYWFKYKKVVQIDPTVNLATLSFKLTKKDENLGEIGDAFIQDIKFYPVLESHMGP